MENGVATIATPASSLPTTMSMTELLEIAISDQDVGTVNFNVLRLLLSDVIKRLEKFDKEPVQLGQLDASQIENYKNYIQGEAVAPIPGVLRVQQGIDPKRGPPAPQGLVPTQTGPLAPRFPPPPQNAEATQPVAPSQNSGGGQQHQPNAAPGQQHQPNAAPGQQHQPNAAPGQQHQPNAAPGQQYPPYAAPGQQNVPNAALGQQNAPNTTPGQQNAPNATPGQQNPPNAALGQQNPPNAAPGQPNQQRPTGQGQQHPHNPQYPPKTTPGQPQYQPSQQPEEYAPLPDVENEEDPAGNYPPPPSQPGNASAVARSPNTVEASPEGQTANNEQQHIQPERHAGEISGGPHGTMPLASVPPAPIHPVSPNTPPSPTKAQGLNRSPSRITSRMSTRASRRMSSHMDHGILKDMQLKLEKVENQMNYVMDQLPRLGTRSEPKPGAESSSRPQQPGEESQASPSSPPKVTGEEDLEMPAKQSMQRQSDSGIRGKSDSISPSTQRKTRSTEGSLGEMRDRSQDISGDVRGSKSSIRASEGVTSATGEASLSQTNISEEASRESVDYEGPERLGSYGNVQDAGVDDGLFGDMLQQMTGIENQVSGTGTKPHKKKKKKDKGGATGTESQQAGVVTDRHSENQLDAKETTQENDRMSVNDMWQLIQLNNRIAGAEGAIQKMAGLIEDLARELTRLRWDTETTQAIQEDTVLLIEGEDKCMGPGICKGHGMPSGIAVCQFTEPAETTTKIEKPALPDDACPMCGKENRSDNNELLNLKKPRKGLMDKAPQNLVSPKQTQHYDLTFGDPQNGTDLANIDLEQIHDSLKNVDFGEFDEKNILQRIETLWEAMKLLKTVDDSLSKRIDKADELLKKIPKERMAKMMMGEYTDVNPGGPVAFSPPPPPPTTPNLHHQSKHQDQVDTQDVDQKADDSGTDKEDIQTLFNNLANVIAECAEQKERIDQLVDAVRIIESGMVTKQFLLDMISDKADKGQINTKVSYDEFGNTVDELHAQLHNLMVEGYQRNENWKKVTSDLAEELSEKLDKVELAPIRAFFKSRLKRLEDRVTSLSTLLDEPDPAGTRKKLLRDYNCLSCNRKVNISGFTNTCTLPNMGPATAMPSSASHRTYDLHRLRSQRTRFDTDAKEMLELENQAKIQSAKSLNYTGKQRQLSDKDVMKLVNRYTGSAGDNSQAPTALPSLSPLVNTQPLQPTTQSPSQQLEEQVTQTIQLDPATAPPTSVPSQLSAMIEAEVALRMSGEYIMEGEEE